MSQRLILTVLIILLGLFNLYLAASFLLHPLDMGQNFGMASIAPMGESTLRADFTSFFGVAGLAMAWGAWRRNADLMLVPALMFAVSCIGRGINVLVVGPYPGWQTPMIAEALHVVLLLAGWRLLAHKRN